MYNVTRTISRSPFFVFLLAPLFLLLSQCVQPEQPAGPWERAREIVDRIEVPGIPSGSFSILDFGGTGDGVTDNREAFDRMIEACREQGGGRMIVPGGAYLVNGPIHLTSGMELHLQEGARLVFGSDPADYLPVVLTSWEGTRCYNYSPFIYARGATDVAITGQGVIDGNAAGSWNQWKYIQDPDKARIRRMNNEAVPLEERIFGEGHYLRPHLVQFYECERILVEDVTITDSPFWCLHTVYSKHITVRGVKFDAHNYNNDGIDPESSEYVLIEEVTFNNRDDNVAIKAGRDLEARTLQRPSRNIVIRNCRFKGHNAIAIGSEMSGGVSGVFVEECGYAGSVMYGFYLKGNRDRGGMVQDIHARDIRFDTVRSAVIIDSNYKNQGSCCPPLFKNIHATGIRANVATDHAIFLKGFAERPLDSVFISGLVVDNARIALEFQHVDYLELEEVVVNGDTLAAAAGKVSWIREPSPVTGHPVWQITSDTAPAVACYFERQAFTGDERYVVYAARRNGHWRLHRTELLTGISRPISPEGRKIEDDDYTVMPDGRLACYLEGWKLYALDVESAAEELLFDYTGKLPDAPRYTGSFTNDGRYTLVYVRNDTLKAIYRTDLQTGEILEVHRHREGKISHPLINPEDPEVITYVPGPDRQNDMTLPMELRARSWKVDLSEGTDRQFLTVPYGYRATHESWSHDGSRFFFFRKTRPGWAPVAICSQDSEGNDVRVHYESDTIRLGHGTVSRDGKWFISDSQEPGKNELVLVDLESGEGRILCYPNSSVDGGHDEFAHVHPSFSPKGNYVIFTSDRTGTPQVYVVPVGLITNGKPPPGSLYQGEAPA